MQLPDHLNVTVAPDPDGSGCPLADAVHRQDSGFFERRREKGAGSVRFMVFGIENLSVVVKRLSQISVRIQLILDPERSGPKERAEPFGGDPQIGFQDALELEKRLVIKTHEGQIGRLDVRCSQAVAHRMRGKGRIPFETREAFFLCRRDNLAVVEQTGCTIVIKSG